MIHLELILLTVWVGINVYAFPYGFSLLLSLLVEKIVLFHLCNFVKNQLSIPWQFWILLQRTWECRYLLEIMILFPSGIHSVEGFLNPVVGFFPPQAISILLSVVAVPVYISTKSVPFAGHSFQHLLSLVCLIIILGRVKQCLIVILIYIFLMISDA